jgi:hypothetical protein
MCEFNLNDGVDIFLITDQPHVLILHNGDLSTSVFYKQFYDS